MGPTHDTCAVRIPQPRACRSYTGGTTTLVVLLVVLQVLIPHAYLGPTQADVRRPACLENPAGERALPAYYYRSAMLLPTQMVTPPEGSGMPWLTKPSRQPP